MGTPAQRENEALRTGRLLEWAIPTPGQRQENRAVSVSPWSKLQFEAVARGAAARRVSARRPAC